jgi:hypothetical protein
MIKRKSLLWRCADRAEPGAGSRCESLSTCCTSLIHCDPQLWYITDTPCICNQGYRTCDSRVPNGMRKDFFGRRYSLLSNFIFFRPASLYCEEYVCIYTYLTALGLCMNWSRSQGLTTLPLSCVDCLEIWKP